MSILISTHEPHKYVIWAVKCFLKLCFYYPTLFIDKMILGNLKSPCVIRFVCLSEHVFNECRLYHHQNNT